MKLRLRTIIILTLNLIGYVSSYAQSANCEILTALLKNNDVRKAFHLDKYKGKPIVLIDTNYLFKECEIDSVYERSVEIVHDSAYLNDVNSSNIIIESLGKKSNNYRIQIYHKFREAFGHVEFKRKKDRYVVTQVLIGNF